MHKRKMEKTLGLILEKKSLQVWKVWERRLEKNLQHRLLYTYENHMSGAMNLKMVEEEIVLDLSYVLYVISDVWVEHVLRLQDSVI